MEKKPKNLNEQQEQIVPKEEINNLTLTYYKMEEYIDNKNKTGESIIDKNNINNQNGISKTNISYPNSNTNQLIDTNILTESDSEDIFNPNTDLNTRLNKKPKIIDSKLICSDVSDIKTYESKQNFINENEKNKGANKF